MSRAQNYSGMERAIELTKRNALVLGKRKGDAQVVESKHTVEGLNKELNLEDGQPLPFPLSRSNLSMNPPRCSRLREVRSQHSQRHRISTRIIVSIMRTAFPQLIFAIYGTMWKD